jgi:hypothetical protein
LILGLATAVGRPVGPRVTLSVRTPVYANALAIAAHSTDLAIRVAGEGVELALWVPEHEHGDASG